MKYISKLDFFAANVQLKTSQGDTTYKTFLGGLLTIIVYVLSLLFAIYVIISWQNGTIPPNISISSMSAESRSIEIDANTVSFWLSDGTHIFSEKQNIITPIFMEMVNGTLTKNSTLFSDTNQLQLERFKLIQPQSSAASNQMQIQYFLIFVRCNQQYLAEGQSCASEDEIDQTLASFSRGLEVTIQLQQYNQKLDRLDKITKSSYLVLDQSIKLYTQIQIQTTKLREDRNIFIENLQDTKEFTNNYQLSSQSISNEFSINYFGVNCLQVLFFQVDNIYTEQQVSYPKIGEILAQIGSITSIIISLKILAEYASQQKLTEDLIDMVLKLKYPKFNDIQIIRNYFGKILDIKYQDQTMDKVKFMLKYNLARKDAIRYMELNSLVAKIIQLQLQLQCNENINQPLQLIQNEALNQRIHPLIVNSQLSIPQSQLNESVYVNDIFM